MRIPARLKRYADKQSLISFTICFISLIFVLEYYPGLFPSSEYSIYTSGTKFIYGHFIISCIGVYDIKNSRKGFWTFDKTILTTMIVYPILDAATFAAFTVLLFIHGTYIHITIMEGIDLYKTLESLRDSWDRIPFNLLTGLFCGVTIVLVNRTILACSRFIARRKGMAS